MCHSPSVRTNLPSPTTSPDQTNFDPRIPATPTESTTSTLSKATLLQLKQTQALAHSFKNIGGCTPHALFQNFFSGSSAIFSVSQRPKQEMPQRVHQRMHNRRREHRLRLPPRPPVKHPGDRRQNHIPPIRKTHVRNVRESKQNRSQHPAGVFVFHRPLQHVLQQSAKQKLLRPSRETKNREREERQGLPLAPPRTERHEMHRRPERNGNRRKRQEAAENVQRPSRSPTDAVSGSRKLPHQQKRRDRDGDAEHYRKHICQPTTGKWPEPMRRRKFHRRPNPGDGDVILPGAGCLAPRGCSQSKRHKNECEDRGNSRQRKRIRTDGIDQVSKKRSAA